SDEDQLTAVDDGRFGESSWGGCHRQEGRPVSATTDAEPAQLPGAGPGSIQLRVGRLAIDPALDDFESLSGRLLQHRPRLPDAGTEEQAGLTIRQRDGAFAEGLHECRLAR